jgi:hypothetical protein
LPSNFDLPWYTPNFFFTHYVIFDVVYDDTIRKRIWTL